MKRSIAVLLLLAMVLCLAGCGEKQKSKTEGEKVTPTATEGPTGTPESTPSPEPTEEVTPTPDPSKLPHTELTEGPYYAIGTTMDGSAYLGSATSNQPAFATGIDFIYLTEEGYPELAQRLKDENIQHSESGAYYQDEILKILSEQTERFDKGWYYFDQIMPERNDSAVFSYTRSLREYNGVIATENVTGYVFDTKTGEPLDITDVIKDTDVLQEEMRACIEAQYGGKNVLLDSWDNVFTQLFGFGHYGWVYSDDGIEYWVEMEYLTENLTELYRGTLKVTEHPELFTEQYVGDFTGDLLKEREDRVDPKTAQSPVYEEVLLELIAGVGALNFDECTTLLDMTDLSYSPVPPEEAEEEQPNITFYDPTNGDKIYMLFWPKDGVNMTGENTLSLLYVMPAKTNGFLLVTDNYHSSSVEYDVIDRSFPEKDGLPSQRTVTFADVEGALAVLLQGFYLYYPELF